MYILYTSELEQVVAQHASIHQYADDSQVYISVAISHTAIDCYVQIRVAVLTEKKNRNARAWRAR